MLRDDNLVPAQNQLLRNVGWRWGIGGFRSMDERKEATTTLGLIGGEAAVSARERQLRRKKLEAMVHLESDWDQIDAVFPVLQGSVPICASSNQ